MKPKLLTMIAFGPYKDEVTIDFARLQDGLFLIKVLPHEILADFLLSCLIILVINVHQQFHGETVMFALLLRQGPYQHFIEPDDPL
jgi:hypothetical protein